MAGPLLLLPRKGAGRAARARRSEQAAVACAHMGPPLTQSQTQDSSKGSAGAGVLTARSNLKMKAHFLTWIRGLKGMFLATLSTPALDTRRGSLCPSSAPWLQSCPRVTLGLHGNLTSRARGREVCGGRQGAASPGDQGVQWSGGSCWWVGGWVLQLVSAAVAGWELWQGGSCGRVGAMVGWVLWPGGCYGWCTGSGPRCTALCRSSG